jgi:hypothetical protein
MFHQGAGQGYPGAWSGVINRFREFKTPSGHVIGQQHIRDAKLCWPPHKTLRTTGKLVTIRIIVIRHAKLDADVAWAPWGPLQCGPLGADRVRLLV